MKQAKQTPVSVLLAQDDILELVLSSVDLASLPARSAVCKSWKSILGNPSFRRRWCQNSGDKESLRVMTSSFCSHRCLAWDPSQPNHEELALPYSPQPFPHTLVVASAGGLVFILRSPKPDLDPTSDLFHLVVGNPVTQEWMELSPLHWKDRERHTHVGALDFAMFVYNNGFKVGLYYTAPNTSGHWCCIYDSATRAWSSLPKLPFSRSYVKAREQRNIAYEQSPPPRAVFPDLDDYFYDLTILGFYDFGRARWSTGAAVRSLRITTGHEDKVGEGGESLRCVLPRPGTCTTRLWDHNGQRYFASGWMYAGGDREEGDCGVDGYGVWKVDENGGLVPVSAVLHDAILEEVYPGRRNLGYIFRCKTAAEGNLVTFSETGIVFVYYLSTGEWTETQRI